MVKNLVLLELIPVHVDVWVVRVVLLESPPGSVAFEQIFDKRAVVAFPDIENIVGLMFSYLNFQVVAQINQTQKIHVLLVLLQNFRLNV
jgi:hypothetical protein